MFCPNCGSKIDDDAKFCFKCGANINSATASSGNPTESKTPISNYAQPTPPPPPVQQPYMQNPQTANVYERPAAQHGGDDKNSIALVGFILSFFCCIPAIVCSAIGLKNANNNGGVKRGFAKAGLIISIISTAVCFIVALVKIITANALLWSYGLSQDFEYYDSAIRMIMCCLP